MHGSAADFSRDGFLVVDDFFTAIELSEFTSAFNAMSEFESIGEKYDAVAQMPEFLRLVAKRETAETVNELLERRPTEPLYCFTNRCRIDPLNDDRRTYGWHQEVFYTIPHGRFIQTWAPLIYDTTIENGTIEVCVGSHKEGIARQTWREAEGRAAQIIVEPDVVNRYPQIAVPMKLGQIMFFDGRLFHRSGRNTSQQTRYSLVGMYHDVNASGFRVPRVEFTYRGPTPREWFNQR